MKQVLKKNLLLTALFAASAAFTACDDDSVATTDPNDIVLTNNSDLPSAVASGQTLTLSEDFDFNLVSAVRVEDGGTLVIEPGVSITATAGSATSKFIVIEQGGKIIAEGTAQKPIVMTSATAQPGGWGGLLIMGRAPINTGASAIAEIGDATYGGNIANDNSGVLKYVRVEYTGSRINDSREHNGITFYGVGNGTVVDYVQSYKGADDGFEMFGGTVNLSHVVAIGSQDDQFDWAEGWSGTLENLYTSQINDDTYPQDKGIEGDNLGSNNGASPFSNPTVRNITLIGFANTKNEDNELTDGIRIREGSKGSFDNVVIRGYGDNGIDARSLQTLQNLNDNSLTFSNVFVAPGTAGKNPSNAALDSGETDPGTVVEQAKAKLTAALVAAEPAGANFDSWKGSWVRVDP